MAAPTRVPRNFWSETPEGWKARGRWAAAVLRSQTKKELVDALTDIMETLYPGGDPEAEWDSGTMSSVAEVLGELGLVPPEEPP